MGRESEKMSAAVIPMYLGRVGLHDGSELRFSVIREDGEDMLGLRHWIRDHRGRWVPDPDNSGIRIDEVDLRAVGDAMIKAEEEFRRAHNR